MNRLTDEELARMFHEEYEKLAPLYGYETRGDTKVFDPKSPNGLLMIEVCKKIATESRKGMLTEFVEEIKLSLDDEARKMESLYQQHDRLIGKILFRNKMIIDELLTERNVR